MSEKRFPCPCCGYPTLSEQPPGTYEICEVCFWEDDGIQFKDPSYRGGANTVSLDDARSTFEATGASDAASQQHVRPPTEKEKQNRVPQWSAPTK